MRTWEKDGLVLVSKRAGSSGPPNAYPA